jgi:preprotein translocase subunit SecA
MNQQRKIIYGVRRQVLEIAAGNKAEDGLDLKQDVLQKIAKEIATTVTLYTQEGIKSDKITEAFSTMLNLDPASIKYVEEKLQQVESIDQVSEELIQLAQNTYENKEKAVGKDIMRQMEIFVYLNTIDTLWIEHLDSIDDLRAGIGLRGYGQRDPLIEYKREAFDMFEKLIQTVDYEIVRGIFRVGVVNQQDIQNIKIENLPSTDNTADIEKALEQNLADLEKELDTPSTTPVIASEAKQSSQVKSRTYNEGQTKVTVSVSEPVEEVPTSELTKVKVEKGGQVISSQTLDHKGQIQAAKVGRNDPCPCGSGLKYKKCGLIGAPQHKV